MARNSIRISSLAVALVAIATITVTLPAAATHNSYGPHIQVVEPDEVNAGVDAENQGEITPDITPNGTYDVDFHKELERATNGDLPARSAPDDQTGERYTDCDTYAEATGQIQGVDAEDDGYNPGSDSSDCYIGFLDQQLEYQLFTTLLITRQDDLFYFLNPKAEDGHCTGSKNPEDRSLAGTITVPEVGEEVDTTIPTLMPDNPNNPADEAIARGARATSDRCDGSGEDDQLWPGSLLVDTNLIEAPLTAAHEAGGSDAGSGTWSLPFISTTYAYLFGEPHPDAEPASDPFPDDDTKDRFVAGEDVFGPLQPGTFGNPIGDLTGACGEEGSDNQRTEQCVLLTPEDVVAYDDNFQRDTDKPRVCWFVPQYRFQPAGGSGQQNRDAGVCGNVGGEQAAFVGVSTAGGLGTGLPTWVHTLPGWNFEVLYIPLEMYDGIVDTMSEEDEHPPAPPGWDQQGIVKPDGPQEDATPDGWAQDYFDEQQDFREGFLQYVVVNPKVPGPQDKLRCLEPNVLATGLNDKVPGGFDDPGVYGRYIADGIDADVYPTTFYEQFVASRDATHDEVRHGGDGSGGTPGLADVQALAGMDYPTTWAEETTADLDDEAIDVVNQNLPGEAQYLEEEDPDPHAEHHDTDYDGSSDGVVDNPTNQLPFRDIVPAGLACDTANQLAFNTQTSELFGGMRFDANIWRNTGAVLIDQGVKDPTLGVVDEEDSDEGVWLPGLYTVQGQSHAVMDSNGNGQFDSCPGTILEPDEDVCPWQPVWDGYNSNCQDIDNRPCGTLLENNGYNLSAGVGMHFVLKFTGPLVIADVTTETDKLGSNNIVGDLSDAAAKNCVVGTSIGFDGKLANMTTSTGLVDTFADLEADGELDEEDTDVLCGDYTDQVRVIEDAFNDQSASTPGGFGLSVSFAKLLPTPSVVQSEDEGLQTGLGTNDEVCVAGTWSVTDDLDDTFTNSTGTHSPDPGNDNGIADDTEGVSGDPGDENIELADGLHRFDDCDFFDTRGAPQE